MMKARLLVVLGLLSAVSAAQAQPIHKCVVDGRTSYQAEPCEPAAVAPPAARAPAGVDAPRAAAVPVKMNKEDRRSAGLPWAGLKVGMSVAEVLALVPGSREAWGGGQLANGAKDRIVKDGVMLAGREFKATYFFQGDRFVMMTLVYGQAVDRAERVLIDLGKLKIEMSQRFGAAQVREAPKLSGGQVSGRMEWMLANGDRVLLAALPMADGSGVLQLGFVPKGALQAEFAVPGGSR
ncbi:MAG: hypothetical protein Q4D19_06785 [Lautropia sp.]|nr:hypothetical protein [Lautropia sp.]